MVYGVAFSNSEDPWSLVGPGCHQVSSGVVVRIVEEKSRVEALLNTDVDENGKLTFNHGKQTLANEKPHCANKMLQIHLFFSPGTLNLAKIILFFTQMPQYLPHRTLYLPQISLYFSLK